MTIAAEVLRTWRREPSFVAQVAHVMRKDFAQFQGLIAGNLVLLSLHTLLTPMLANVATINSGNSGTVQDWAFQLGMLVALGVLVASVVQADSPTKSESFWRRTPTDPDVIVVAKFSFLLFVILPACIAAEVIALRTLAIPLTEAMSVALRSAVGLLGTLIYIALLAAVTPNLKTCTAMVVGLKVGSSLLWWMSDSVRLQLPFIWDSALAKRTMYLPLLLHVVLFRQFFVLRLGVVVTRVALVAILLLLPLMQIAFVAVSRTSQPAVSAEYSKLTHANFSTSRTDDALLVHMAFKAIPDSFQLKLHNPHLRITHSDGRVDTVLYGGVMQHSCDDEALCPHFATIAVRTESQPSSPANAVPIGDSLVVTLSYFWREKLAPTPSPNSDVEFSARLILQKRTVRLDIPADSAKGIDRPPYIKIETSNDDLKHPLTISGRAIDAAANPVASLMASYDNSARAMRFRTLGMSKSNFDTLLIIPRAGNDTIRLESPSGATFPLQLPMPGSALSFAVATFQRFESTKNVDFTKIVPGSRLVFQGWDYFGHSEFRARLRVTP